MTPMATSTRPRGRERDAGRRRADRGGPKARAEGPIRVTVSRRSTRRGRGYVVYEDTRRAAAGRRLDRTLAALREAGIAGARAGRRAEPARRGPRRARDDRAARTSSSSRRTRRRGPAGCAATSSSEIRRPRASVPVEHVVADVAAERRQANVLVLANETVARRAAARPHPRARAREAPASFLIVSPQSDPTGRRTLRPSGGCARRFARCAARGSTRTARSRTPTRSRRRWRPIRRRARRRDHRLDLPRRDARGWLRRDLVERLRIETKLPVEHVVVERERRSRDDRSERARRHARAPRPADRAPELARQRAVARDAAVHRVGDDALRLVLHGALLRPRRQPAPSSGRRRASTCRSSWPASTRRSC